jgi:hypothetical protein
MKIWLEYSQVCPLSLNNSTEKMMQDLHIKLNLGLPRQHSTRRLFHPQNGLKFKEENSDVLHFEYSFLWSRSLDTSESKSKIPRKF